MSSAPYVYQTSIALTSFVHAGAVRFAYRIVGPTNGVPLIVLNRFRGTMDDWDPALIDIIGAERQVVLFDGVGVGRTGGKTPRTISGTADTVFAFVRALGFRRVDLLGFSIGGLVAQQLTLDRPGLVRKLILAATGAGYVENAMPNPEVRKIAASVTHTAEDLLYLLFRDTPVSRAAGIEFLGRLQLRADAAEKFVNAKAIEAQLAAEAAISTPETSLLPKLCAIHHPTLVAAGDRDRMIPTYQSFAISQALPNAKLVIYPDSAHGFLFQYPQTFGWEALQFLED
jgi:pimeloyl-ACP methyl ester carboxylesterase